MQLYKIHTSLETLPIFNWDKIQQTQDLRFLLYNPNKKLNKYLQRDLLRVYNKLVIDYLPKTSKLITAKKRVVVLLSELVVDIATNSKDITKLEKASKLLRALMIDSTHEEFLWTSDFTETPSQKQLLTRIAIAIKKYNEQINKSNNKTKQTIYQQTAYLETELGVSIDIHKCSVKMYQAYIEKNNTKKIN